MERLTRRIKIFLRKSPIQKRAIDLFVIRGEKMTDRQPLSHLFVSLLICTSHLVLFLVLIFVNQPIVNLY